MLYILNVALCCPLCIHSTCGTLVVLSECRIEICSAISEGRQTPTDFIGLWTKAYYIQCPYCLRRFNEAAAERHISFCKEQASRRVFAPGQKSAKQGKQQMTQRREPTLTGAVESLLQNRVQEAAIAGKKLQLQVRSCNRLSK
uniref:C2HC/C3H-type domain-containing protein n=1 Tax=Chelydra serpentina TaxID=8475 RepID=A0A8C3RNV3_CHESE